jgi:hypothetical protein
VQRKKTAWRVAVGSGGENKPVEEVVGGEEKINRDATLPTQSVGVEII